jgi:hypothetical protein
MRRVDACLELANESLGVVQAREVHFQGIHAHDPAMAGRLAHDINDHKHLRSTSRTTPRIFMTHSQPSSVRQHETKDCASKTDEKLIIVNNVVTGRPMGNRMSGNIVLRVCI